MITVHVPRRVAPAACLSLALIAVGCGGSSKSSSTLRSAAVPTPTKETQSAPQEAQLALAAGRSSKDFEITAPSPAKYRFNVAASGPSGAALNVGIHTSYGAVFSVFDTVRYRQGCHVSDSRDNCFARFPLLPSERAGKWTVVVSKRSAAPAGVHVAVSFLKP
jgi:hypothetical protein